MNTDTKTEETTETKGCDCIKDLESKLAEKLSNPETNKEFAPRKGVFKRVVATNIALMLRRGKWALNIPFTVVWDVGAKRKEKTIHIAASHCPFCGKEIPE